MKLKRVRSGCYAWTYGNASGTILYETTAYGDTGWLYYVDTPPGPDLFARPFRSDYPVDTLRYCRERLMSLFTAVAPA